MLKNERRLFTYFMTHDLGFAPNPFHGFCTLATCKPNIRKTAKQGDIVIGFQSKQGNRLLPVYVMIVDEVLTFESYWKDTRFFDKRPVRTGSRKMLVGDNIYYPNESGDSWQQLDSAHSNEDGTTNHDNLKRDLGRTQNVLVSSCFLYLGNVQDEVPSSMAEEVNRKTNKPNHRTFYTREIPHTTSWALNKVTRPGRVIGDPLDFKNAGGRWDLVKDKFR